MSFFDIVLDFILMDAFEDLENPPSSVLAVLRNRWLSDSFKETVGHRSLYKNGTGSAGFFEPYDLVCLYAHFRPWRLPAGPF